MTFSCLYIEPVDDRHEFIYPAIDLLETAREIADLIVFSRKKASDFIKLPGHVFNERGIFFHNFRDFKRRLRRRSRQSPDLLGHHGKPTSRFACPRGLNRRV